MKKIDGISINTKREENLIRCAVEFNGIWIDGFNALTDSKEVYLGLNKSTLALLTNDTRELTYDQYLELIELYGEEEKYHWKLKGMTNNERIYFNQYENNWFISLNKQLCGFKTQFTEKEFKAICQEKGIMFEAFEKEEMQ